MKKQSVKSYLDNLLWKQTFSPVWHAGPDGSTKYIIASESQSTRISLTFCVFPDSSPFIQSFFLDLLQNQEFPVFFFNSKDSLFV